jgi:4-amino-4-deoxy-L-arabinose transferase-like glycosyltransferase
VTTSTNIAPKKNAKDLAARIGWAVLICATLYVCYFSHLGAIGFVGPDEPRYAWIARDMAETGDWVTPRLYGKPWFEKPPLYYWGAAICFKLFGVSEAAARLPSAISALLATLALAWLAWRIYGAETARWLLLLLPTTVGMIGFSHAAATDMPFSAMLTVAMVCTAVVVGLVPDESSRDGAQHAAPLQGETDAPGWQWLALILFGFFLGLAVLAKGPAGIILCGSAIFFWALFTKRWRDAFRLFHPVALASFCVTALPWYTLCARRNPDFFRVFIIEHNFKRYLTPEFQHIQPFWFYVPVLFASIFPWSFIAVLASVDLLRKRTAWKGSTSLFFLFWFAFPVLFFTISKSKLPGYILPSLPPLVFLTTRSWASRPLTDLAVARISLFTGILILTGAAVVATRVRVPAGSSFGEFWAWPWVGGIAGAGLLLCVLALSHRRLLVALTTCALVLSAVQLSDLYLLPRLDHFYSARLVTPLLAFYQQESIPVCVYELQRSWVYGLNFYAHRELPECVLSMPLGVQAIVGEKGVEDLTHAEPPRNFRVHPFDGARLPEIPHLYVVSIGPLAANPPGSGKPQ